MKRPYEQGGVNLPYDELRERIAALGYPDAQVFHHHDLNYGNGADEVHVWSRPPADDPSALGVSFYVTDSQAERLGPGLLLLRISESVVDAFQAHEVAFT